MIPLIVIAAIVAIIVIIKKMFESSESTYKSSYNYSSSKPPLPETTYSSKPAYRLKASPFEIEQAQYLVKQLNESTNIINKTTDPKVYFKRLNFIFDTLMEMTKYEKYDIYKGSTPTQDLDKLKNDLGSSVKAFIDRTYEAQILKTCNLKTHQGKVNSLNKYFDSMFSAFECANTFWSGSNEKVHYTGNLFTDSNRAYLNSLYEDCKQAYDLEGNANINDSIKELIPKTEKPQLVFDVAKEKELLAEYRKHKDDIDSSCAYYAVLPLIDFYYKYRSLDDKYLNLCIKYCNICISLLSSSGMKKYLSDGICIPAFKKLVIIYDKKKEYTKALEVIDKAVKYDREVEYYEKKRSAILKKMNK